MNITQDQILLLQENLTTDELNEMTYEVNCWDGSLDWLDFQSNDDEFFETYFTSAIDAVRAVFYGDYRYMDEYVKFNAYGNLESFSEFEKEAELKDYSEEIIETYVNKIDNMSDGELKNKIIDLLEENE